MNFFTLWQEPATQISHLAILANFYTITSHLAIQARKCYFQSFLLSLWFWLSHLAVLEELSLLKITPLISRKKWRILVNFGKKCRGKVFKSHERIAIPEIESVSAEIFLIWTNVTWRNVARTIVTVTLGICSRWSPELSLVKSG